LKFYTPKKLLYPQNKFLATPLRAGAREWTKRRGKYTRDGNRGGRGTREGGRDRRGGGGIGEDRGQVGGGN